MDYHNTEMSAKKNLCFLFIYIFFLKIPDVSAFLLPESIKYFHKPVHDNSYYFI